MKKIVLFRGIWQISTIFKSYYTEDRTNRIRTIQGFPVPQNLELPVCECLPKIQGPAAIVTAILKNSR